jgi:hypothetical protein
MSLPTDAKERKEVPLYSGLFKYFPDALAEVAHLSYVGNQQHNPGQPLHWAKEKSKDHQDCLLRHLLQSGTVDSDGILHDVKVAWRALANLQTKLEAQKEPLKCQCPRCGSIAKSSPRLYETVAHTQRLCEHDWHCDE